MNIILDILTLGIFALSAISGIKKGFVKTIMSLCSGIVCLALAVYFSPTVGNFINENYMQKAFEDSVYDKLNSLATTPDNTPDVEKLAEDEQSEFLKILEKFNVDLDLFKSKLDEFKKQSFDNAGEAAVEYVTNPMSKTISYVVAFIAILLVSGISFSILTFVLDGIVKLPILRTANKFFGIVSGLLMGLLWIYIISMVVEVSLPYMKTFDLPFFYNINPTKTLIFKHFYLYNPIYEIVKAFFA